MEGRSFLYDLERRRAKRAFRLARGDKEYKSAADKFPAMVMNCGLLQALSFYRGKEKLRPLFDAVKEWFCERYGWDRNEDLLKRIMDLDPSDYREKTREALAFLTWLKRFADIKYQESEGEEEDEVQPSEESGGDC